MMHSLRGTQEMCICFGRRDACVMGYMDTDYGSHLDMRRSTSSYVSTFVGGVVSWISCAQKCVSLSTIEAKYIVATTKACKKAIWLSQLVGDLGVTICTPLLHSDNMSSI